MKKEVWFVIIGIVILLIAIIGIFFLKGNSNATSSSNIPVSNNGVSNSVSGNEGLANPKTFNVEIKSFTFSPVSLTINKGDSVVWTNGDSAPHTIVGDSGNELNSESLATGKSFTHIFNTIGEYDYHCSIHPSMKAKIIVK